MMVFRATLLLTLLARAASTTLVHGQEKGHRQLVRRDGRGPSGDLIEEKQLQGNTTNDEIADYHANITKCSHTADAANQCRMAYAYGTLNHNTCVESDNHLICTPSICEWAAVQANVSVVHWNNATQANEFQIPADFFDMYPKGCFKAPCTNDNTKECFYFNSDGNNPTHPWGYPVCSRPRYLYGKNNTNPDLKGTVTTTASPGADYTSCPPGYEIIDTEAACSHALACLGIPAGVPLTIANGGIPISIDRMWYSHGCFMTEMLTPGSPYPTYYVHFNPVKSDDIPSTPGNVSTTIPICRAPDELGGSGSNYVPLAQHQAEHQAKIAAR